MYSTINASLYTVTNVIEYPLIPSSAIFDELAHHPRCIDDNQTVIPAYIYLDLLYLPCVYANVL